MQIWGLRGPLPHYINATAGLVKAVLHDEQRLPLPVPAPSHVRVHSHDDDQGDGGDEPESDEQTRVEEKSMTIVLNSVSCTYAIALIHFVTGFTDTQQTRKEKISMYRAAEGIGLGHWFVDLRNDIVHVGKLPLGKMRDMTVEALEWLWENYWKEIIANDRTEEKRRMRNQYLIGMEKACTRLERVVEEFATFFHGILTHARQNGTSNEDSTGSDKVEEYAGMIEKICENTRPKLLIFADLLSSHYAFQESIRFSSLAHRFLGHSADMCIGLKILRLSQGSIGRNS